MPIWRMGMCSAPLYKIIASAGVLLTAGIAHGDSCIKVSSPSHALDAQVLQSNDRLELRAGGEVTVSGDTGSWHVSTSGQQLLFSAEMAPGSAVSLKRSADAIEVCRSSGGPPNATQPGSVSAAVAGESSAKQHGHTPDVQPEGVTSTSSSTPSPTSGSTGSKSAKPSCLETSAPVNCDLHAGVNDLAAPESPAFTVLGLTPQTVTRPSSPLEFATAVQNGFDDRGNFQSGVAMDAVPFLVFAGRSLSLGRYNQKGEGWVRILARTQLSFGTTKGVNDPDKAVRLAVGLRSVLWQAHDPRSAFYQCVQQLSVDVGGGSTPEQIKTAMEHFRSQVADCRSSAKKIVWNSSSWVVAGAPSWISKDGSTTNFESNGAGFWSSFAYGVGSWGQLIIHGRRRTGESVPDPATTGQFIQQASTAVGGALRFGTADFNGTFEGLFVSKKLAGKVQDFGSYALGIERKIGQDFWINVAYRYAPGNNSNLSGILTSLKWNFSQTPQLVPK